MPTCHRPSQSLEAASLQAPSLEAYAEIVRHNVHKHIQPTNPDLSNSKSDVHFTVSSMLLKNVEHLENVDPKNCRCPGVQEYLKLEQENWPDPVPDQARPWYYNDLPKSLDKMSDETLACVLSDNAIP